jgi:serine/threonine protein phosphatase PrpC
MVFECVSRTHVGLKRKVNEDAVIVRSERGLWAVADGMGGHEAGDVASGRIADALLKLPIVYNVDELVENAVAGLRTVNHELIVLARGDGVPRTIGSTVVGLAVAGRDFRCFWAGDSRAYRWRNGRLDQLSRDHSLVQELVTAGMLSPEEAHDHPQANVITRAVGVSEDLRVDTRSGNAEARDIFLLATDGLTRVVTDEELAEELGGQDLDPIADRLIDLVLSRGAPDNVSLVLVRIAGAANDRPDWRR